MKQLIYITLIFLILGCSKESIEETNTNCGIVTALNTSNNCDEGYSVIWIINNDIVKSTCISEQQYNTIEIGSTYCETNY